MSADKKTLLCVGDWILEEALPVVKHKTERFGVLKFGQCVGAFYELDYAFGFFKKRLGAVSPGINLKLKMFQALHKLKTVEFGDI